MYKIKYNANPNMPLDLNHKGDINDLILEDSRDFNNLNELIDFYYQCDSPITSLYEFTDKFKTYWNKSEKEVLEILELCSLA